MNDPLDDRIRGALDGVPVPPGLIERAEATVRRRRRRLVAIAAGGLLAILTVAHFVPFRRPPASEPPQTRRFGVAVPLSESPPASLRLREADFRVRVESEEDLLVFEFVGGAHD